jgi:hypothetical protein
MEFVQVISFTSDRAAEELVAIEQDWRAATRGRRTNVIEWFLTSRADPRRKLAINGFASYESAMINSNLPETDALSGKIAAVVDGDMEFFDGDLVDQAAGERAALADGLIEAMSTAQVRDDVFADDVFFDLNVPQWRYQVQGIDTLRTALAADLEPASVVHTRVTPSFGGFVLELAVKNDRYYSRQLYNVRTRGGLIAEVTMYCTGNWDLGQLERQQAEAPMLRPD